MKDYYKILGVRYDSSEDEIKKAYRDLSKKYHPDLNPDNKEYEDKFKEISEAYSVLSNKDKKYKHDNSRFRSNDKFNKNGFDEWVNDFNKENFRGGFRGNTGNRRMPNTDYLDIRETIELDIIDIIKGKQIEVKYEQWIIGKDFLREKSTKVLNINLNIREKYIPIVKKLDGYQINIKLDAMGSEDVHRRTNAWGEAENILLYGNYYLDINVIVPNDIELEDSNIIQYIDIPLYSALFGEEKIRINTILGKSYDAEITTPKKLNNLKFNIKDQGILGKNGTLGNYIIRFNVIPPDLSKISKSNLKIIKESFIQN